MTQRTANVGFRPDDRDYPWNPRVTSLGINLRQGPLANSWKVNLSFSWQLSIISVSGEYGVGILPAVVFRTALSKINLWILGMGITLDLHNLPFTMSDHLFKKRKLYCAVEKCQMPKMRRYAWNPQNMKCRFSALQVLQHRLPGLGIRESAWWITWWAAGQCSVRQAVAANAITVMHILIRLKNTWGCDEFAFYIKGCL